MPGGEYWGGRRDTALELDCEEQPSRGQPLLVGRDRRVSTRTPVQGRGIASAAIEAAHLSRQILDFIFTGSGYDGEADFDGTSPVLGIAPSSGVYTLTRDVTFTRMHVRSSATIRPAGFKIFARELHLWGGAIIHADGNDGTDAPGGATKAGGGAPVLLESAAIILGGAESGGSGGQGGETASEAGDAGNAGDSILVGLGGDGAAGIAGAAVGGGGAGGAAGAGGTVSGTEAVSISIDNLTRLMRGASLINGGAGGGGGGGGGATAGGNDGGGGGGGGAGGGVVMLAIGKLFLHSWTGRISANGGQGGDGFAGTGGGGNAGQGGGGGGGVVHVLYSEIEGGSVIPMPFVRNSTPTQGVQDSHTGCNVQAWGGRLGTNGSGVPPTSNAVIAGCGTVRIVGPDPYIPVAEIPAFTRFIRAPRIRRARGFVTSSQFDKG